MGEEARNVERLKQAYGLWHDRKGDSVNHWMSIVAEHGRFGSLAEGAAPLQFARSYSSREALREYFQGLLSDWDMIHYTVDEYVAQGDAVFARGSTAWKNKKTGKSVETPKADFWRFRDGEVVEFYEYYDTARFAAAAVA